MSWCVWRWGGFVGDADANQHQVSHARCSRARNPTQTMKQLKAKLTFAKDKVIEIMSEGKEAASEVQRRAAQVRQKSDEERESMRVVAGWTYTGSGCEMRLTAHERARMYNATTGANIGLRPTRRCGRPRRFCTTRASATRPCRWTQSWRRAPRCRRVPRRRKKAPRCRRSNRLRGAGPGVERRLELANFWSLLLERRQGK